MRDLPTHKNIAYRKELAELARALELARHMLFEIKKCSGTEGNPQTVSRPPSGKN
jgi:hypothetical protein